MATLSRECTLGLDASSLQQFEEHLTLTARNNIVFLTMEDNDGRILLVDVVVLDVALVDVVLLVGLVALT